MDSAWGLGVLNTRVAFYAWEFAEKKTPEKTKCVAQTVNAALKYSPTEREGLVS